MRGKCQGFVLYRQTWQCNENITDCGLCVKAVTEPDSAESTENTERPGPNLRKIANKCDLLLPVSSGTGSMISKCYLELYT